MNKTGRIQGFKAVRLLNAVVPNTYKVPAQTFYTSTGNVTIASAGYNLTHLCTALQTALNAAPLAGYTWTVSYDVFAQRVTITSSVAVVFQWASMSTLARLLGFVATNSASVTSVTGTRAATVYHPIATLIRIDCIANGTYTCGNGSKANFMVPYGQAGMGTMQYVDKDQIVNEQQLLGTEDLSAFHVQFLSMEGDPLHLDNGDWLLVLEFI